MLQKQPTNKGVCLAAPSKLTGVSVPRIRVRRYKRFFHYGDGWVWWGLGRRSVVEYLLMVLWVIRSILLGGPTDGFLDLVSAPYLV